MNTFLKVHVLMNHANGCPTVQSITEASVNDIDQRHIVQPEKGATYVFDKGCCDYNWWAELDRAGAYFVTRLKANAAVEVIEQFSPSETQNAHENSHNDNKPPPYPDRRIHPFQTQKQQHPPQPLPQQNPTPHYC